MGSVQQESNVSQELRDRIIEDSLVNKKLIINGVISDSLIELITMQIFKFNDEDDLHEAAEAKLDKKCRTYERNDDPIQLYINSPGGNVISSLSIISAIEASKTPVYTYALGHAASAAALILMSGHVRFCQKYCSIMIHEMSGRMDGTGNEHKDYMKETDKLQKIYDEIIIKNSKIKQAQLNDVYTRNKDWYLSSSEALKYKVVDEIF